MISVEQCRGARALLGWSAQELAHRASVGVATVRRFEMGNAVAATSVDALASALSRAGISFIAAGRISRGGGEGIRLTSSKAD